MDASPPMVANSLYSIHGILLGVVHPGHPLHASNFRPKLIKVNSLRFELLNELASKIREFLESGQYFEFLSTRNSKTTARQDSLKQIQDLRSRKD